MSPSLYDRVLGGLFGALVGDALGVPVEFSNRAQRDLDPVCDMRAFGMWNQPTGTWSDDGSLLLCSAEGLIEGFDPARVAGLFVRWLKEGRWAAHGKVFDIGAATHAALIELEEGTAPELAGGVSLDSNGNGSLMRILPVALRFQFESPVVIADHAMWLSRLTHGHVRSQLACALYCLLAVGLLQGSEPLAAYRQAIELIRPRLEARPDEQNAFARLISGELGSMDRRAIRSGGYVVETLEAAIWCLLQGGGFKEVVLRAVNLGGDTDTTGCVAGGLAGLIGGVKAIPLPWIEALPRSGELKGLTDAFATRCCAAP